MIKTDDHAALARCFQRAARSERSRHEATREKLILWRVFSLVLVVIMLVQTINAYLAKGVTP